MLSGYRSPQTNAMLRRRSRQVAKYSQHMEGKAMDAHFQDVDTATIRDIAMRMQAGGVGFYPGDAWVHIDSGDVRYWPRMNRNALARLFPDGKTVFIPSDGQPMPGYDQARAEIEARGGEVQVAHADASAAGGGGLFSWLFGAQAPAAPTTRKRRAASTPRRPAAAAASRPAAAQVASADAPREAPASAAAPQPTPAPSPQSDRQRRRGPADPNDGDFPAPLPPRKPVELILADAPTPPARPTELAFAPAADTSGDRDLIAALLARGGLPRVITRGVGAPRGILALTEVDAPEPPERPAILDRAAALAAPLPPLPPTRNPARVAAKPAPSETSAATPAKLAAAAAPAPAPTARGLALLSPAQAANPYGDLVTDGFAADDGPEPGDGDRRAARRDAVADRNQTPRSLRHKDRSGPEAETVCLDRLGGGTS